MIRDNTRPLRRWNTKYLRKDSIFIVIGRNKERTDEEWIQIGGCFWQGRERVSFKWSLFSFK